MVVKYFIPRLQNQLSSLIYLQENKKYYIEVILSTISTSNVSVGVSITNGSNKQSFQFIPSNFFSLIWIGMYIYIYYIYLLKTLY